MGKGEIARYKQFLLFLQCFQEACFPGASKGVIVWEWVKAFCRQQKRVPYDKICPELVRKHFGKRRKCWLPAFSPFPKMFSKAFLYRVIVW